MATGRHANVWNLGLEAAGVEMNGNKVKVPLERTKKRDADFLYGSSATFSQLSVKL